TPTGDVTFLDGTTIMGTVALRRGKAQLWTSNLPVGRDPIQVDYGGGPGFAPSTATVIETINPGRSRTSAIVSGALRRGGQAVPLTAPPDQGRAGAIIAPGIGTIQDDTTIFGAVPLSDDMETSARDTPWGTTILPKHHGASRSLRP